MVKYGRQQHEFNAAGTSLVTANVVSSSSSLSLSPFLVQRTDPSSFPPSTRMVVKLDSEVRTDKRMDEPADQIAKAEAYPKRGSASSLARLPTLRRKGSNSLGKKSPSEERDED